MTHLKLPKKNLWKLKLLQVGHKFLLKLLVKGRKVLTRPFSFGGGFAERVNNDNITLNFQMSFQYKFTQNQAYWGIQIWLYLGSPILLSCSTFSRLLEMPLRLRCAISWCTLQCQKDVIMWNHFRLQFHPRPTNMSSRPGPSSSRRSCSKSSMVSSSSWWRWTCNSILKVWRKTGDWEMKRRC